MKAYSVVPELESTIYTHLLDWAATNASTFHLVLRHGLDFSDAALSIIQDLESDTLRIRVSREWAGTMAMDAARIIECRVSKSSLAVLHQAPSIFAWCYPERPEDIAFFAADGRCLFNSVSHHEEAWICTQGLKEWIDRKAPGALLESEFEASDVTFDASEK